MAKLKLREDNPATQNNAYAMVAKDGEIVDFHKECRCEGQVEVWLNRLLTTMRDTLRYFFSYTYILTYGHLAYGVSDQADLSCFYFRIS